jgi:hypothetical protein
VARDRQLHGDELVGTPRSSSPKTSCSRGVSSCARARSGSTSAGRAGSRTTAHGPGRVPSALACTASQRPAAVRTRVRGGPSASAPSASARARRTTDTTAAGSANGVSVAGPS